MPRHPPNIIFAFIAELPASVHSKLLGFGNQLIQALMSFGFLILCVLSFAC